MQFAEKKKYLHSERAQIKVKCMWENMADSKTTIPKRIKNGITSSFILVYHTN